MTNKLSIAGRLLVAFASGALVAVFFLPVWRIDLFAPQYPEGLTMNIWINKLTGDTDIINGLNHYIGMNKISESMFPEFRILPFVVCFYMLLGLIVAISGRTKLLLLYLILTVIGGCLAMYDFYQWGYEYGHQLDPNAPIQVPGLSYQPPLFGHKRLLNFDAYSFPHIGGWIVIGAAVLAFGVWIVEKLRTKLVKTRTPIVQIVAPLLFIMIMIGSCKPNPRSIEAGKENCSYCKMTIMDLRYSGELLSKKGKVYTFDDAICLSNFLKKNNLPKEEIQSILVTDYKDNTLLIPVEKAWMVQAESISSPMGGHTVSFSQKTDAKSFLVGLAAGKLVTWTEFHSSDPLKTPKHAR